MYERIPSKKTASDNTYVSKHQLGQFKPAIPECRKEWKEEEAHLCELRGAMVGGTQYKAEDLEAPCPCLLLRLPQEDSTYRLWDKLTGRALRVTPKANGPPEAWANAGVLRRTIWGCTCLCMCLCAAKGDQGTLLWQDRLSILSWLLEASTFYLYLYTWAHFCPVRGFQSKPAKGEQDVFPQGTCTHHLPVFPMDLELWQHCLSRKWIWHFPAACAYWKQREEFTDRY